MFISFNIRNCYHVVMNRLKGNKTIGRVFPVFVSLRHYFYYIFAWSYYFDIEYTTKTLPTKDMEYLEYTMETFVFDILICLNILGTNHKNSIVKLMQLSRVLIWAKIAICDVRNSLFASRKICDRSPDNNLSTKTKWQKNCDSRYSILYICYPNDIPFHLWNSCLLKI